MASGYSFASLAIGASSDRRGGEKYTCVRATEPDPGRRQARRSRVAVGAWTDAFIDIRGAARPEAPFSHPRQNALGRRISLHRRRTGGAARLGHADPARFRDLPRQRFRSLPQPTGDTRNYFEFEINALNTGWDLFLPKPYREGGKADNSWEIPGLRTAVASTGRSTTRATATAAGPSKSRFRGPPSASAAAPGVPRPATSGASTSRASNGRREVQPASTRSCPGLKEDNWVWSPQGAINMHIPERWGYVKFAPK